MSELVTITEAAELKGVSRQAIYAAIDAGKLKTVNTRVSAVRIRLDDLARFEVNPNMQRAGRKPNRLKKQRGR
jgi:excisionase family DNA binding protein